MVVDDGCDDRVGVLRLVEKHEVSDQFRVREPPDLQVVLVLELEASTRR